MDPEALERVLDAAQHCGNGIPGKRSELADVLAAIAVLRRLLPTPHGLDGGAEAFHLRAGVVVVVLPFDLVARKLEQACDRVAVRAVPGRRDGDGAGRVRGDHLHLDALPRLRAPAAESLARLEDRGH